jgi:transposase InsO family protein
MFLHTHAQQIWACDFLPVTDLFFRSLFAFFIIELHSRKVIHVGVTRSPTDAWTAQQLREATAFGVGPKYLIRDNDGKFGMGFARVAKNSRIEILTTPYHAPRANAICERFLGSVRRECLDHLLILHERQHEPRPQCLCTLLQPSTTAGSASSSRFRRDLLDLCQHSMQVARSSPSPSWVGYITTTAEVHKFFQ